MFSRVCETIVPSTTGNRSRTRPIRRATISAREGSPSRAGSVADMSTPIITPRVTQRRRTCTPGSAARRIACQDSARSSIEEHIRASASTTQNGARAEQGVADRRDADPVQRERGQPHAADRAAHQRLRAAPASKRGGARRRAARAQAREAGRAPGGTAVGGREPHAARHPLDDTLRLLLGGYPDRVLVGGHHLGGDVRPREPLRTLARGLAHAGAPLRVDREVVQRLAERGRVAGRRRARRRCRRARRRDSPRCRRPRPACPRRTPRSAPCRSSPRRATARTAGPSRAAAATSPPRRRGRAPPRRRTSSRYGSTSSCVAPATVSRAFTPTPCSASNARSSTGRPFRSSARPTNSSRSSSDSGRGPVGAALTCNAVGDHAVAAAVEALGGPARRLGHGDAHVHLVVEPAHPDRAGRDPVRDARRVGVEGGDQRGARGLGGEPAGGDAVRLVDVDHVVVAVAQLTRQLRDRARRHRDVGNGPVGRDADRAPERDQVVRHLARLWARATMPDARQTVVGVEGRKQPHVVPVPDQLLGKRFDVPPHAPRIRIRVRGDERYSHWCIVDETSGRQP